MLKKSIKYTDYNGVERDEIFYFNLSKAEIVEMELSAKGGLSEQLKAIIASDDEQKIIETFKKIILKAYGVKSEDGKRFIKSKELQEEFSQTEAYSELFMELSTQTEAAAEFINGIVPVEARDATAPGVPQDHLPKAEKPKTDVDIREMSIEELIEYKRSQQEQ